MLPRRNERFLRNIFALAQVAQPAVGQRANQGLVARHDATEGVAVAGQTARDKFGVAVFLCDHHSIGYHTARYVPGSVNQVTKNITARVQQKPESAKFQGEAPATQRGADRGQIRDFWPVTRLASVRPSGIKGLL